MVSWKQWSGIALVLGGSLLPAFGAGGQAKYVGYKFTDQPALQALVSTMPSAWQHALQAIHANLGIEYNDRGRVALDLDDLGMSPGHLGNTEIDTNHPVVTVYVFATLAGRADFQEIVTHEATHAVMREKMGKSMEDLPLWIAEGLAVYASDAGPARVRLMVWMAPTPRVVLDGLEAKVHTGYHYAEDYLAFERMRNTYGPQSVVRFTAEIMNGTPWKQAITDTTGETYETFVQRSYDYACSQVDPLAVWDGHWQEKANKAMADKRYDDALAIYQRMVDTGANTETVAIPQFHKGVCLFAMGRRDEARQIFQDLSRGELMAPEATLFLGHCEAVQGHVDAAVALYNSIQGRFPSSYAVPAALYHGVQLLKRAGRAGDAQAMEDELKHQYSQSVYAFKPPPEYEYRAEVNPLTVSMPGMEGY